MLYRSSIRLTPPQAHLTVSGELDAWSAVSLRRDISAALTAGSTDFTVDAGGISFIDAAGLSAFVRLRNAVVGVAGTLTFTPTSAPFRRVVEVTGLGAAFGLDPIDRQRSA
jgi:anti-sigma B factor antagonist